MLGNGSTGEGGLGKRKGGEEQGRHVRRRGDDGYESTEEYREWERECEEVEGEEGASCGEAAAAGQEQGRVRPGAEGNTGSPGRPGYTKEKPQGRMVASGFEDAGHAAADNGPGVEGPRRSSPRLKGPGASSHAAAGAAADHGRGPETRYAKRTLRMRVVPAGTGQAGGQGVERGGRGGAAREGASGHGQGQSAGTQTWEVAYSNRSTGVTGVHRRLQTKHPCMYAAFIDNMYVGNFPDIRWAVLSRELAQYQLHGDEELREGMLCHELRLYLHESLLYPNVDWIQFKKPNPRVVR